MQRNGCNFRGGVREGVECTGVLLNAGGDLELFWGYNFRGRVLEMADDHEAHELRRQVHAKRVTGWGLGIGVWGLGFGVWGLGFGVWGLGFGVWGSHM